MQKKQVVIMILFVGMAVFIQGCVVAAVGAGAGTVAYVRGDLQTVESKSCLLYTSPSPRDRTRSRMPSSA